MIEIRAHHLLCLATFRGNGYSPDFVANMQLHYSRFQQGERAVLVCVPDAICQACPEQDCQAELRDRRLISLTGWQVGEEILVDERVRALIPDFQKWLGEVCQGCPWLSLCQQIEPEF